MSDAAKSSEPHSPQDLKFKTPKSIEVAAGLVFRDGFLLITQRKADVHLGGLWEFPGGKREANETFEACLQRELREELAIEIDVLELIETIDHVYPEKSVRLKFFRCAWVKNEPQAIGCDRIEWVTGGQLAGFSFPEADALLLKKLQSSTELWR